MAINQNTEWDNENTGIFATSGAGKSQLLRSLSDIPNRGARLIAWDPDKDHDCHHYETRESFVGALRAALHYVKVSPKTRGFRLGYAIPDDTPEDKLVLEFEWFCGVVWRVLDGLHRTYIFIEELSDVSPTTAKATPYFGRLLRRCRKYGGRLFVITQRPAEIAKTCFRLLNIKYLGRVEDGDDEYLKNHCKVPFDRIPRENLHFLRKCSRGLEDIKIKYQPVTSG